jgi:protein kinase-like protein
VSSLLDHAQERPPASDRFVVQRRLGEGAVGVVYHATDRSRGIEVALKTLRRVEPLGLYRFKQEFRALADVVHPNLAELYELSSEQGEWFFTMELVDGVDFLSDVRGGGTLDVEKLRRGLRQLALGVSALHRAGKLHRDLKPSNVLVTREGRVVILDFGLVTDLGPAGGELGGAPRLCGTAAYVAPEQAAAEPLSEASDWYSVGAMLYEALTGALPFNGTVGRILRDKRRAEPRPPREMVPDLPVDLERLAIDLLRIDSAARPSGQEILARLDTPAPSRSAPSCGFVGRSEPLKALLDRFEEEALEEDGTEKLEALAFHAEGAGENRCAAAYLVRAAETASATLAFEHAARLYRRALKLEASLDRAEIAMRIGDALASAGLGRDAAEAYLLSSLCSVDERAIEAKRRAAEQLLRSGRVDEGLAAISEVLEPFGLRLARTPRAAVAKYLFERARLAVSGRHHREQSASRIEARDLTRIDVCWSVALGLGMVDVVRSSEFLARYLRLALDAGEPHRVARGLLGEALSLSTRGRAKWKRATRLFAEASAIAERLEDPQAIGLASLLKGMAYNLQGSWLAGLDHLSAALELFESRCTGVAWEISTAEHMSIWALAYLGRIGELVERVPRLLADADRRGDLYEATLLMTGLANLAWLASGDVAGARAAVEEGISHWSQRGFHLQHYNALLAETQLDLYAQERETALDRLREHWPALRSSMLLEVQQIRVEAEHLHGRARLAALGAAPAGERRRHLAKVERIARRLQRSGAAWATPLGDLLSAGAAQAGGHLERAAGLYEDARLGFWVQDMMLYAKVAERRKGELLGGEEGGAMVVACDQWMVQANIRCPPRFADMLAPVSSLCA